MTTLEIANAALKTPLKALKLCKKLPKTARMAFHTSSGVIVWFTDKCTYVGDDRRLYKGVY